MKLIDDNGKLFGKVNIIDFVIVFGIIVMVFLALKYFYLVPEDYIYVQVQLCEENPNIRAGSYGINCGNIPLYLAEAVNKNDSIIRGDDVEGLVTEIDSKPKTKLTQDTIIEVKLLVKQKKDTYEYHAQEVKIGSDLRIQTLKAKLIGKVRNIGLNKSKIRRDLKVQDVEIEVNNRPLEVVDELKINDVERDLNGKIIAKIIDFGTTPAAGTNMDIKLKAKLLTEKQGNDYWFKDQKVKIGAPVVIETSKIYLRGNIVRLGFGQENEAVAETKEMVIEIRWQNQRPWVADAVSVGDKELRSDGTVLAEVIDKYVEPAVMVVTTESGDVYLRENPYNKDITLKVRILAELKGDQWLFHNKEIKTHQGISIKTDNINIGGEITKVFG